MLLTIPIRMNALNTLVAVDDAVVKNGRNDKKSFGKAKMMNVEMNASQINRNQVSYVKFDLSGVDRQKINAAIFQVYGNSTIGHPYRFHVYALDNNNWNENTLNWKNAPNLEKKQIRITDVGTTAHVAGEIVVDKTAAYHQLDVTELLRNCREQEITFVLIREVRQLGDDSDNGKSSLFGTKESKNGPILSIW